MHFQNGTHGCIHERTLGVRIKRKSAVNIEVRYTQEEKLVRGLTHCSIAENVLKISF